MNTNKTFHNPFATSNANDYFKHEHLSSFNDRTLTLATIRNRIALLEENELTKPLLEGIKLARWMTTLLQEESIRFCLVEPPKEIDYSSCHAPLRQLVLAEPKYTGEIDDFNLVMKFRGGDIGQILAIVCTQTGYEYLAETCMKLCGLSSYFEERESSLKINVRSDVVTTTAQRRSQAVTLKWLNITINDVYTLRFCFVPDILGGPEGSSIRLLSHRKFNGGALYILPQSTLLIKRPDAERDFMIDHNGDMTEEEKKLYDFTYPQDKIFIDKSVKGFSIIPYSQQTELLIHQMEKFTDEKRYNFTSFATDGPRY